MNMIFSHKVDLDRALQSVGVKIEWGDQSGLTRGLSVLSVIGDFLNIMFSFISNIDLKPEMNNFFVGCLVITN